MHLLPQSAFITEIHQRPRRHASFPPYLDSMFSFKKVWVGVSDESDVTAAGKGYGPRFDGNSILFLLEEGQYKCRYLYVGSSMKGFSTREPIVDFKSPVANNDVPCPYAMTASGLYYLPETDEVIHPPPGADLSEIEIVDPSTRPIGTITKYFLSSFKYKPS